jgi:hypothetical protein
MTTRRKTKTRNRQWAIWTSDGSQAVHQGPALARIAGRIEESGLAILAAVELSVLARPEGGAPIRVMVAANRGNS